MGSWVLSDPATLETWVMPLNPNKMTSPHAPKNSVILPRGTGYDGVARVLQFRGQPFEWSFSGSIRSQEHYDAFVHWTSKVTKVRVLDHLGRTWEVRITGVDLEELRPSRLRPWRFNYTVKANMYGRIS